MSMIVTPIKRINIKQSSNVGDKSITHRLLILASISSGVSHISNANTGEDVAHTVDCLNRLGANIICNGSYFTVNPIKKVVSRATLDCGNSGTTARLLAGLVAGLGVNAKFIGDPSLSSRPMSMLLPLQQMGANVEYTSDSLFVLTANEGLKGITYRNTSCSAQIKSAILIAGLFAEGITTIEETDKSRDHTERALLYFGANIKMEDKIILTKSNLYGRDVFVPNDISTASYVIALALCKGKAVIHNVGINPTRMGVVLALQNSHAKITIKNIRSNGFEEFADIYVYKSKLKKFENLAPICQIADEIPLLALLSAYYKKEFVVKGASSLTTKETNRLATTAQLIQSLGGVANYGSDSLTISKSSGIIGGNITTYGDHRIALCGIVAGNISKNGVNIDNADCINISSPNFYI